jgi:hypothetical protein
MQHQLKLVLWRQIHRYNPRFSITGSGLELIPQSTLVAGSNSKLSATGERDRADLLLESSLAFIETIQRQGFGGSWISDVQIYAL